MSMTILLVGCGNMGRAMLDGWIEKNIKPNSILVVDPSTSNLELASRSGCRIFTSPLLIEEDYQPDVIVLAVKPQVMTEVIPTYKKYADKGALIISIAAGTRIDVFENYFGKDTAIIRTMPNTPAAVRKGMLVSVPNPSVTQEHRRLCDSLMSAIGTTAWVDDENMMDAVTGLSGSGPAYVFHMIEAMTKAGVAAGLPEDLATTLAKVTVAGAGELAQRSNLDVAQLRKNVTSPNGTTAAGLDVLMANNSLIELMTKTVEAAKKRSIELS
ncbi:pyrroline-5-carboxylate reductase [Sneathiella aquimaris]|uniref:pyrroline-5-carboxylate reductase n=1 Tax=Sneathiella aquimaris TaxID=2599305 RepID=UPI00146F36C1|nr:pyrroline-5-carboxylate reductase [Sneathiella aquimaris]